ncbi:SDR family oxidoreductase [Paracoccus sp. J39]|uniref:SDR family oxidoreductase n=1 Tax=Paracoccus sp. J39 TaxID=935848 RepID=UPI00048E66F4|nr:SDR family oxidoreductase [Paracoccus sp. J39]
MDVLDHLFGVAGKTVLVTGGSRGIGASIAETFVKAGARVYICSRSATDCADTAARLAELGECHAIPADLATAEGRTALVAEFLSREEKLEVLINNAGAIWAAPLAEYPESGWDKAFNLNVKGLFFLIRDLAPALRRAGSHHDPARVINIGSIDGFHIPKHETYAYSSAKAAAHQLSKHLADQLAPDHITVNVIAPGMFPSKMLKGTLEAKGEETIVAPIPLKRLTNGDDMGGTALFLAGRASAYVTGVVIPVDGGYATLL